MQSKLGSDPGTCVLPCIRELTAGEATELHGAPLATWLAMVALVLIVIGAALLLAAWREHKNKPPVAARITTLGAILGKTHETRVRLS